MKARRTLDLLKVYESRNVSFIEPDGSWPIVWERAKGVHVWDADGKKYLDLTAAFGVCAAGHANQRVVAAAQKQAARLLHAMGDVHPHRLKGELARELSRLTFERWTKENKPQNEKKNSKFKVRQSPAVSTPELEQSLPPHPGPLPQGEGESQPDRSQTTSFGRSPQLETILPLPEGEGRGEGEA